MSHHSGSESGQEDPTKSINEEFPSTSSATGARPKQTVRKEIPSKSRTSNKNERTTGTRTKRTSKKEFPSTSSATGARPKQTVRKEFPSKSRTSNKNDRTTVTRTKRTPKKDGMIEKENDSSPWSCTDEDDILSDKEQEKSSSEDSSSSERNQNFTGAFLHKGGGGKFKFIKPNIYLAGGNIGTIKHEGFRKTIIAQKMADNGSTFTNTEHDARNTLSVQTPYDNTSAKEQSTTGSPTTAGSPAPKRKSDNFETDDGFQKIPVDIFINVNKPLNEKEKIYEGYQRHVTGQKQRLSIKVIPLHKNKNIREVQNLVTLESHPNVVRIIRSKEQQTPLPTLYIVMEPCSSKTLQDYLNENREKGAPFDFKKAMSYSEGLVKGMKHIHQNRIIHGDLKPENIVFSLKGDQIKVSNFRISKQLEQAKSKTKRTNQGTPGYRAPETFNSDVISMKADIHSLGVTLYSLFTNGKHPFGEDPDSWNMNIKRNEGRNLSGLPEEMGDKKYELLDLLDQMLEFDPKTRPTIEEVSEHSFFSNKQTVTEQGCVHLSHSISMFRDRRISTHGEIYEGELRNGILDARPIVLKLVDNIPQSITEARILTKLNYHSHILSLIQTGTFKFRLADKIYMALDKCHHENLRDFVTNQGFAFNLSLAIEIAKQMVEGVKYIHLNRIIHKDLKPDNILFSLDQKLIKITGFGASQEIESVSAEVTEKEQFGTGGFRPPESFGKGVISQKSDIFSLGAIFYFVLSNGEHPFGDDSDSWNCHVKNGIIDLSALLVTNKHTTEHLIRSMIEHKINDRPTIWQVSEHPFWTGNEIPWEFDNKEGGSLSNSSREEEAGFSDEDQEFFSAFENYFSDDKSDDTPLSLIENSSDGEEDCVQLSDSIWMMPDRIISTQGEIYEGELRSEIFDARPIVLKLVENIPQSITEARILTKLNYHSHVLSLIHTGTFNFRLVDQIYIALDKCHHENLREFVTNRKEQEFGFSLSRAIEIAEQMVDGMKYIHENRIIHKDIKPDNILFSLDQKLIKIADFGISQEIHSTSTEIFEKGQFGTDGFRPPESFGRGIISQKSDIFSLGVTFYFVLSNGEHPFGEDPDGWNYGMKNGEINLSGLLVPNIKTTEHLIKSMIEHKINDRPTVWQVSEHPFWTGNEVSCDFDYHSPESAASLIPSTAEEPTFGIGDIDVDQLLEIVKKNQLRNEAAAAKRRQRTKDSEVQVKLSIEEADGMTEKKKDSSTSSTVDEDNILSDQEQEKSSSEHSSSFERSENMTEAVLHKGGGDIMLINPINPIICIAAGNIENIKHDGSRETINALKMAHRGGIFTTTEHNTRRTLAVVTPSGDTSAEDAPTHYSQIGSLKVTVRQGDITKDKNDVIVNSLGPTFRLSDGGRISKVIERTGGKKIQEELLLSSDNKIRVTSGGNLPCKKIIHVNASWDVHVGELYNTIYMILMKAEELQYRSLSLPAIGAGRFEIPGDKVADVMFPAIKRFSTTSVQYLKVIDVVISRPSLLEVFQRHLLLHKT